MHRSVRDYQIRLNSLNIPNSEELVVDGMGGPKTRAQIAFAVAEMDLAEKADLFDPSGITRIHWHWTASTYNVDWNVVKHYNNVFDSEGNIYDGGSPPEQQAVYNHRTGIGVSHSYRANTGAIGLSVAAMHGATSKGVVVDQGKYPLTWKGIDAMLETSMEYCREYDIRPSKWTTITHAEVGTNISIKQRGKWDIRVLPDNPNVLLGSEQCGEILRKRMVEKFS